MEKEKSVMVLKKLLKILVSIVFGMIGLCLLLYFSLWIYAGSSVPKELKDTYNQDIESYFTDEQYDVISFAFTREKNYQFTWRPFIFDIIFFQKENNIAFISSSNISAKYVHNNKGKYTMMDWRIMDYGFLRYIITQNDPKKCIDIIMKDCFLGPEIYGIEHAGRHYFSKEVKDLSNEELISLVISLPSPIRFGIGTEMNKARTQEILDGFVL